MNRATDEPTAGATGEAPRAASYSWMVFRVLLMGVALAAIGGGMFFLVTPTASDSTSHIARGVVLIVIGLAVGVAAWRADGEPLDADAAEQARRWRRVLLVPMRLAEVFAVAALVYRIAQHGGISVLWEEPDPILMVAFAAAVAEVIGWMERRRLARTMSPDGGADAHG